MRDSMSTELYIFETDFAIYSVRKLTEGIKYSTVSGENIKNGDVYVKVKFNGSHTLKFTLNDLEKIIYEDIQIQTDEELNPDIEYKCPFCLKDSPHPSDHKIIRYTFVSHENCVNKLFEDLEQLIEECPEKVTVKLL